MVYEPANFGLSGNLELSGIEDMFFLAIEHLTKMDDDKKQKCLRHFEDLLFPTRHQRRFKWGFGRYIHVFTTIGTPMFKENIKLVLLHEKLAMGKTCVVYKTIGESFRAYKKKLIVPSSRRLDVPYVLSDIRRHIEG